MTAHQDVAVVVDVERQIREMGFDAVMAQNLAEIVRISEQAGKDESAAEIARLSKALSEAEAERDDALGRVDELEADAEVVSNEFEKDCWKAMRRLLAHCKFDWRDVDQSEGVSADAAYEHIKETIDCVQADGSRWKSKAEAAESCLSEAMKVIKPFAKQAECWPEIPDNQAMMTSNGEDLASLDFNMADFRAARRFLNAGKE